MLSIFSHHLQRRAPRFERGSDAIRFTRQRFMLRGPVCRGEEPQRPDSFFRCFAYRDAKRFHVGSAFRTEQFFAVARQLALRVWTAFHGVLSESDRTPNHALQVTAGLAVSFAGAAVRPPGSVTGCASAATFPPTMHSPRLRLAPSCSRARLRAAVAELGVVRRCYALLVILVEPTHTKA